MVEESIGSSSITGAIRVKRFMEIKIFVSGFFMSGEVLLGYLICLLFDITVCQSSLSEKSEGDVSPVEVLYNSV